jgi:hypothetical protein
MSLIVAVGTVVGERVLGFVSGVAQKYFEEAALDMLPRYEGLLHGNNEEKALAILRHVDAESAAYPPERAIEMMPMLSTGIVGIFHPRHELRVETRWINFADFPVHVSDVMATARVGDKDPEWVISMKDEFVIRARGHTDRTIKGYASLDVRPLEKAEPLELKVEAVIAGPWRGTPQKTHRVYEHSIYMPVFLPQPAPPAMASNQLLTDPKDVGLAIGHWLTRHPNKNYGTIDVWYDDLDRELRLAPGQAKQSLASVAEILKFKITAGEKTAYLVWQRGSVILGGG